VSVRLEGTGSPERSGQWRSNVVVDLASWGFVVTGWCSHPTSPPDFRPGLLSVGGMG